MVKASQPPMPPDINALLHNEGKSRTPRPVFAEKRSASSGDGDMTIPILGAALIGVAIGSSNESQSTEVSSDFNSSSDVGGGFGGE